MELLFRLVGAIILGLVGWRVSLLAAETAALSEISVAAVAAVTALGAIVGFISAPRLIVRSFHWILHQAKRIPPHDLVAGLVGLVLGLIVSMLLAAPLSLLPGLFGRLLPFVVSVVFGILGMAVMVMRQAEVFDVFRALTHVPSLRDSKGSATRIVVDTSAIIDGRIADISHTGFLQGTLVIPRFILGELQKIADSADTLRRNRGRRGLEMLNKLQKDSVIPIEIVDFDGDDRGDVDGKLVKLAKKTRASIITNDYNLNRVAEIQGVTVLNVNELANALRPVVIPGEEMAIRVIQEGKEYGQGVGYLDDGTMVVIEGGKRFLNNQVDIVVTRVLQTVAGRMIFGQPKGNHSS